MEHHPVFAEGDGPPVAIGREVPDGEKRHDDSGVGTMHDSRGFDTCRCPLWVRLSTMQMNKTKAPRKPRRSYSRTDSKRSSLDISAPDRAAERTGTMRWHYENKIKVA